MLLIFALQLPTQPVLAQQAGKARTLPAFRSEAELTDFLRKLVAETERRYKLESKSVMLTAASPVSALAEPESITNTQHAGVDEGGIIKMHGDHLIILRRGRLFTVRIGSGDLRPISAVDAFGPDIDPERTWYDEMLVHGNKVVVIGYSYERGGTEVGVFNINAAGRLKFASTYHFGSNDYYSSRNYASRLIGSKLIFYTPLRLSPTDKDLYAGFPAFRKWHAGAKPEEFRRIADWNNIYHPGLERLRLDQAVLHTVTICDLTAAELDCKARGVMGEWGRVFYVSPRAVYVWMSHWSRNPGPEGAPAMVYRMPLDGSAPSAIAASGSPVDQFSFDETEDGYINVLVRSDAAGDVMWEAERAQGSVALLRVPIESFGDGSQVASRGWYRALPIPPDGAFQNRFVGEYVLYGSGKGWFDDNMDRSKLFVAHTRYGNVVELPLQHGVDRIEAMGVDVVVVGAAGNDLHFSGIRLANRPAQAQHYVLPQASQGELRSHGFFYKPDGRDSGVLGLPVLGPSADGATHLLKESAAIVFVRNTGARFESLGKLQSRSGKAQEDACKASCVDWYGNSRPIFVSGRVLALMGYEIVEGEVHPGGIREMRRISFAPRTALTLSGS